MEQIVIRDIFELETHELANLNPMCSYEDYLALKSSIVTMNGVIHPLVLYRGKIVDGRNRLKAYKELLDETFNEKWRIIKTISLDSNMSEEELREYILALESRRHKSKTQKAIQAWFLYDAKQKEPKDKQISMSKAARLMGVSKAQVSRVNTLHVYAGVAILNVLFAGKKVVVKKKNKDGVLYDHETDSIPQITKYYQDLAIPRDYEKDIIMSEEIAYIELLVTRLNDMLSTAGKRYMTTALKNITENTEKIAPNIELIKYELKKLEDEIKQEVEMKNLAGSVK